MIKSLKTIILIVIFGFSSLTTAETLGRVVNVIDGDTVKLKVGSDTVKVRLQGIDAPERGQPYGKQSKRNLERLLAGKTVSIDVSKTDRYGRIIAVVFRKPSGCNDCAYSWDINLEQVKSGYAWWYKYYSREQSWIDRRAYQAAEQDARVENRGLWAAPDPVNPYDWRKSKRY